MAPFHAETVYNSLLKVRGIFTIDMYIILIFSVRCYIMGLRQLRIINSISETTLVERALTQRGCFQQSTDTLRLRPMLILH